MKKGQESRLPATNRSTSSRIIIATLSLLILAIGCSKKHFREAASSSMTPTIQPNESLVADTSAYKNSDPKRWDVVIFHAPPMDFLPPNEVWDMRVVGLPGESLEIREDGIYIDGKLATKPDALGNIKYLPSINPAPNQMGHFSAVSFPYKIPADSYFLLGDNSKDSFDSRFWGALPKKNILGKVEGK